MSDDTAALASLRRAVAAAARLLEPVEFRLPGAGRQRRRELLGDLRRWIDGGLRTRLDDSDAPVLAVLVGPSGAGKSTLLNGLARGEVSEAGVLRPTTDRPVLWAHPSYLFRQRARLTAAGLADVDVVRAEEGLAGAVSILDLPGIGSDVPGHAAAVRAGLKAADLCVFVTSGERYADAASWDVLREIRDAGRPLVVVLDRVEERAVEEIRTDLTARLTAEEISPPRVPEDLVVTEQPGGPPGAAMPADAVAGLRARLAGHHDPVLADQTVGRALAGAATLAAGHMRVVAEEIRRERETVAALQGVARVTYDRIREELRGRVSPGDAGSDGADPLDHVVTQVVSAAAEAAAAVAEVWREDRSGGALLAASEPPLDSHAPALAAEARSRLRPWFGDTDARRDGDAGRLAEVLDELIDSERDRWLQAADAAAGGGRPATLEDIAEELGRAADRVRGCLPAGPPRPTDGDGDV